MACLALVMCSVSLTVPFIPDLVKFNKRGLAYAYLGLLFTVAILLFFIIIELEVHTTFDIKWFFVSIGAVGVVADLVFCWGFSDSYKIQLRKKRLSIRYDQSPLLS